jgi:hypothetical protein
MTRPPPHPIAVPRLVGATGGADRPGVATGAATEPSFPAR